MTLDNSIICKLDGRNMDYFKKRVVKNPELAEKWGSSFGNTALNSFLRIPLAANKDPFFEFFEFEGDSMVEYSPKVNKIYGCKAQQNTLYCYLYDLLTGNSQSYTLSYNKKDEEVAKISP